MSTSREVTAVLYLLFGTNTYRVEQELFKLERSLGVTREIIDAATLTANSLLDIVRGNSLFTQQRLVVCRGLSEQKALWDTLATWADEVSRDTTLVLIEQKLDRRTKVYKILSKVATVVRVDRWRERDRRLAEDWVRAQAKQLAIALSPTQVSALVTRAHVPVDGESYLEIDQFILYQALRSLSMYGGDITDEAIAAVLPPTTTDRAFDLLTIAARGDAKRSLAVLEELRVSEAPQRIFALIAAQWSQLVALALGDGPTASLAAELSIHPYVAEKLRELSKSFNTTDLRDITNRLAEIDVGMKLSQFDPWDGVERALLAIALR